AYNALGQPQGNMGIALGDVDGSGRFAVFITHLTEETHTLWVQERRGLFRDLTAPAGLAASRWRGTGFGTVLGDFNNDGALDLLVTGIAGPARLFRNVAPDRGHWLLVRALDPDLKRDAYGAEVIVAAGGKRRHGWVNPGSSYLGSNDPRVHFGLGR